MPHARQSWASRAAPTPTMAAVSAPISREDVAHVARLARLDVTEDELDRFTGQLAAVLEHAADVAALDTKGVPPTAHPLPLVNVLREDEPRPSLDRDEVLAAAPDAEDGRFRVPRILGEAP
jgi:aspartyl-tRNA(Asn)/glutamyl-tRNA(Gln) amidotransferase subunit C